MKIKQLVVFILLGLTHFTFAHTGGHHASSRSWQFLSENQLITASFLMCDEDNVVFLEKENGEIIAHPITDFVESDQHYVLDLSQKIEELNSHAPVVFEKDKTLENQTPIWSMWWAKFPTNTLFLVLLVTVFGVFLVKNRNEIFRNQSIFAFVLKRKSIFYTFLISLSIGCQSEDGEIGPQGASGSNSLINITLENAGNNCENGGLKVETGLDKNANGTLDNDEVTNTNYVCNGANGNTSLTSVTTEAAGNNCTNGGTKIASGVDENGNGKLDENEISTTALVCNGSNGSGSLTKITTETAGTNCTNGGLKLEYGTDKNGNGMLENDEISATSYVCNGSDSSNGSSNTSGVSLVNISDESAGANCANGGSRVDSGIDQNNNGVLDSNEIQNTKYVCNSSSAPTTDNLATMKAFFEKFEGVTTSSDDNYLYISSDGIPSHQMMVGITSWQQQVPINQDYTGINSWAIPLKPELADSPLSTKTNLLKGAIAIAVNGIPIFNPLNNRGEDANAIGELDKWGGHSGRADDYHYHVPPTHLQSTVGEGNPIAYAVDGYPVYGETTAQLDEHLGILNADGSYQYHTIKEYPYFIASMRGKVTLDPNTTAPENQVTPQAQTKGVRPSLTPLQGAEITGFSSTGTNAYSLNYTVNSQTYTLNYSWDSSGTYTYTFVNPDGTSETQTYQR